MENVTKPIFPSVTVTPLSNQFRRRTSFLHMPGTHGSSSQDMTSAMGEAYHGMMMMHLAASSSADQEQLPNRESWPTPSHW